MSQTKAGKCFWLLVVFLGFITAGYLITSSYTDWQESPISTTLSTKPISELDFPTVTVCPPKGSHTALNYDLMKADNDSLTDQDRDNLKRAVYDIFVEPSHREFIDLMLTTVNPGNVKKTVEGFHTFPKSDKNGMLEIIMSNNYGEIKSPGFGEPYDKDYYKKDIKLCFNVRIPAELKVQVGRQSLVVELEVNTRKGDGLQEKVEYIIYTPQEEEEDDTVEYNTNGDNIIHRRQNTLEYKQYLEYKTWPEAEAHCQSEGGHLASVTSQEEQEVAKAAGWSGWLGGSNQETEGRWTWTDGTTWSFENWDGGWGEKRDSSNCVFMNEGNEWWDYPCANTNSFICQLPAKQLTGKTNLTLIFNQEQLTFSSFIVVYSYWYNQELVDSWKDKRMTGFRLSWRIDPPPLEKTVQELGRSVQTPGPGRRHFYKGQLHG